MRSKRLIFLAVAGLLIAGVVVVGLTLTRSAMQPADTKADQLPAIPLNGRVSVVGQITGLDGAVLTIEVLEGNGFDVFDRRTGTFLAAQRGAARIVMGGEADVKLNAIAQFDGLKTGADSLTLERIVILTGFVTGPAH